MMINMGKEQFVDLSTMSREEKVLLLREIGYDIIGDNIIKPLLRGWIPVIDRYTGDPVTINNMAILPSNKKDEIIIIDDNPLSIICYLEEFDKED